MMSGLKGGRCGLAGHAKARQHTINGGPYCVGWRSYFADDKIARVEATEPHLGIVGHITA
jgi:hypothetical protein